MIRLVDNDQQRESLSREIVAENRRYQSLKKRIEQTLAASRKNPDALQPMANLLEKFRDELAMHFALEIASDSIKEAIDKAPRLSQKAIGLLEDQEDLYLEICDITDSMHDHCDAGTEGIPQAIVDRWELLNHRLRQHDVAERELICEAFYVDVGGGD